MNRQTKNIKVRFRKKIRQKTIRIFNCEQNSAIINFIYNFFSTSFFYFMIKSNSICPKHTHECVHTEQLWTKHISLSFKQQNEGFFQKIFLNINCYKKIGKIYLGT